ncbi:hypothetical protein TL16_g00212 [Triparma laevis f. inornata]|uniref:Uncharacterized protein n=1 Tax=Triparma laevis f. inornata TaxID=1714386 RepID=A0A9W6ZBI1_9STRA|nr:hypothetical protein TL16_g00212 [Triparma laevis f. inornata]
MSILARSSGVGNTYGSCNIDENDLSSELASRPAHTTCSPPNINHCFSVTGFGSEDYAGNGIYCALNTTVEMGTLAQYRHMSKPNEVRYEMMLSSKHQAMEDGDDVVWSWMLVRVKRDFTSKKNWVAMPIYQAKSFVEKSIPTDGWVAVKTVRKNKGRDDTVNFDGEFAYDHTEPNLVVKKVELGAEHLGLLWGYEVADGLDFDNKICIAEACGEGIVGTCGSRAKLLAAAQLAEISVDNVLATEHYQALLNCLFEEVAEHSMIPRQRRWELAEAHDLGDLYLAKGDVENAVRGYHSARGAVRSKGGNIDTRSWSVKLSDFSIGGGLAKVLGEDFLKIRSRVILGRDTGDEWKQLVWDWGRRVGEGGKELECREDEDLVEMDKDKKFCKKYVRHSSISVEEGGANGGVDVEAREEL